jgi:hypothetical protein
MKHKATKKCPVYNRITLSSPPLMLPSNPRSTSSLSSAVRNLGRNLEK